MDMNLGKLWEVVRVREAWPATVHGVAKRWRQLGNWKTTIERPLLRVRLSGKRFLRWDSVQNVYYEHLWAPPVESKGKIICDAGWTASSHPTESLWSGSDPRVLNLGLKWLGLSPLPFIRYSVWAIPSYHQGHDLEWGCSLHLAEFQTELTAGGCLMIICSVTASVSLSLRRKLGNMIMSHHTLNFK